MQLARLGYSVDIVADGRAAVEAAQARPYNVVLMDGQMPEMDGYEAPATCARGSRRGARRRKIRAPLHHRHDRGRDDGRPGNLPRRGNGDYISKPVQASDMAAAIVRATNRI